MPYVPPYIDNTGMHIPTYAEIRDDLIQQMKSIFGDDIYIDEDSKDYQQISILPKRYSIQMLFAFWFTTTGRSILLLGSALITSVHWLGLNVSQLLSQWYSLR